MREPHRGEGEGLARTFPEKTVIIRSGAAMRCYRLSPRAQFLGLALMSLATVWSAAATGLLAVEAWQRVDGDSAMNRVAQAYETRIAALEAERDAAAAERARAEARSSAALNALAARHDAVASGLASEKALSASVEALRLRVATLAAERDRLIATAAASSSRMAELETALAAAERDRNDLSEALHRVALALDATAGARDGAVAEAMEAEGALGLLEAGVEQQRDAQSRLLAQIEDAADRSIGPLEKLFGSVGIDVEQMIEGLRRTPPGGAGGPFVPAPETLAALPPEEGERVTTLLARLERVALLREASRRIPFGRPVNGLQLSSGFGLRSDPFNGRRAMHEGVDFRGPIGTPVLAAGDGEVIEAGVERGYGRIVRIRHANGFETVYAHLNRHRVRVGDQVRRGDRIGDVGNTGRSTGPHLHYEVRYRGRPVNPSKFIEAARHVL
jgi:murein DD-endopeptidase MepM/ murein hydrolase activator NlpD